MAADGNLSTQEAEKGGYTRLDYIISSSPAWVIQREIPSFKWKRKYKNKKKNSKSYVASVNLGRNGSHNKLLTQQFLFKHK